MTKKKKYISPTRRLIAECDDLVRAIIRKRDNACVTCGKTREQGRLDVGHLIKRGKHSVRWDLTNCNAQCSGCNLRHNHYPEYYEMWFIKKYGPLAYMNLIEKSQKIVTHTEIEAIRDNLTNGGVR